MIVSSFIVYTGDKYEMTFSRDIASLMLFDTRFEDGATYKCEAQNKIGKVSSQGKLIVQCE